MSVGWNGTLIGSNPKMLAAHPEPYDTHRKREFTMVCVVSNTSERRLAYKGHVYVVAFWALIAVPRSAYLR